MQIRLFAQEDIHKVVALWNACVLRQDIPYIAINDDYFAKKFLDDPNHDPRFIFVAMVDDTLVGFIHGVCKSIFLPKETHESTPGFVTALLVDPAHRRKGVGSMLLDTLLGSFRAIHKSVAACSNNNPINIDWLIPGTQGHDHNNAPGVDIDGAGYPFFLHHGFAEAHREVAMYMDLQQYEWLESVTQTRQRLALEDIWTGCYDASLDYDYDGMCDRIPSEYWRSAIKTEIEAWKSGKPCTDIRFLPNGVAPRGPRPMLVATHAGKIVGFTGPVDKQLSGRGFFTGICTDPLYERRGIATVLFNLLMQSFIEVGATFSTLFTGDSHHAQRLYERTGFRVVKRFALMRKPL